MTCIRGLARELSVAPPDRLPVLLLLVSCSVQEEDWLTTEVYQILSASGAAAEIKYWV